MTPLPAPPQPPRHPPRPAFHFRRRTSYNVQVAERARRFLVFVGVSAMSVGLLGQTPQPFPRPGTTSAPQPAPGPASQPAPPQAAAPQQAPQQQTVSPDAPTEATLGLPIFPAAQFIASYDAGREQRYYLFGSSTSYAELVTYYRTVLKERGDQVFEEPPTHMFQVGRFRAETMAFPPGVTIKDWTSSGSAGYPNPRPGGQPGRYPTIIMIVPAPPAAPDR